MKVKDSIHMCKSIQNCNHHTGDCLTVALAMKEVFGGKVILFTENPNQGFNHAVLEKENNLYDGYGLRSFSEIISMHIPKEKIEEQPENHIYHLNDIEKRYPDSINKELKERIIKELKQIKK